VRQWHDVELPVNSTQKADKLLTIDLLLMESHRLRYQNPEEMEHLARLALAAALRLKPEDYRSGIVADYGATAAAALANAERLRDRLPCATATILKAMTLWRQGSGNPQLLGQIADYAAAILCHLRHFPEALTILDAEIQLWEAWGDTRRVGRALVTRAVYTGYANDPRRAVELLCRAIQLIDPAQDAALLLAAGHSIVWFMTELGWFDAASQYLPGLRGLYSGDPNRLNVLRLTWLEARVCGGTGKRAAAEVLFREVREGFRVAGLSFPAALVSIDLALLWFGDRRFGEIEELAGELLTTFRALGVPREGLASVVLIEEAARARQAALGETLRAAALFLQTLAPLFEQRRITPSESP
jgi:hypothetical protein